MDATIYVAPIVFVLLTRPKRHAEVCRLVSETEGAGRGSGVGYGLSLETGPVVGTSTAP